MACKDESAPRGITIIIFVVEGGGVVVVVGGGVLNIYLVNN